MGAVLDGNDIAFLKDAVQEYESLHEIPAHGDVVLDVCNCTFSRDGGIANYGCCGNGCDMYCDSGPGPTYTRYRVPDQQSLATDEVVGSGLDVTN